jgi:hypothetical protein
MLIVVYGVTLFVAVRCVGGQSERASEPAFVICGYQRCSDKSGRSLPQPHQVYHIHPFHSCRLVISENPHSVFDADIHINIDLPPSLGRQAIATLRSGEAVTCEDIMRDSHSQASYNKRLIHATPKLGN